MSDLNTYAEFVHLANKKWWVDLDEKPIERNFGELIALCHSELSEALEGHRKTLQDDKLPHRKMAEVELVDCMIRIFRYGWRAWVRPTGSLLGKDGLQRRA
jgi:hypothetical protein